MRPEELRGKRVTLMGLGLNGGGLASAKFLLRCGADLTITDLKSETELLPSLEALGNARFRLVAGRHEDADFSDADIVIKNPGVKPGNPFLAKASRIETDLSLFFSCNTRPVIAITGSKGKSSTASAIHWGLLDKFPDARIGGNIAISPLGFLDAGESSPVVMELSSFQLGDLVATGSFKNGELRSGFPPFVSIVTNIFHDHQNYYGAMEPYVRDKEEILRHQLQDQHTMLPADEWGERFASITRARVWWMGKESKQRSASLDRQGRGVLRTESGEALQIFPENLAVPGLHQKVNMLSAGTALHLCGVEQESISSRLASFGGVEHRLELVRSHEGVRFINDSAATIPEAVLSAVKSLPGRIHLICGGTDKSLSFSLFPEIHTHVASMRLLSGTASDAIARVLADSGLATRGIFDNIVTCVEDAFGDAKSGDYVLLSPGCASFGMFLNEFDRGRKFRDAVMNL